MKKHKASQPHKMSWVEATLSTFIGLFINFLAQLWVYPYFNIHVPIQSNVALAVFFTLISVPRGYFIRRLFNFLHIRNL